MKLHDFAALVLIFIFFGICYLMNVNIQHTIILGFVFSVSNIAYAEAFYRAKGEKE